MNVPFVEALFLKIANMSINAGWIVFAVLILRIIFRKAPRWIFCVLWGLVAIRLVCPFTIESVFSLIPSSEPLPENIIYTARPYIDSGITSVDRVVNPIVLDSFGSHYEAQSVNPTQIWSMIYSWLWVIGIVIMSVYALGSYVLLKKRVATATMLEKGIKQSERVPSPFVLGVFRPIIYLPYHLSREDMQHVISHERAHIARKDHWWKPLGFILLSVYWFNPLIWLAYILLCRDIEAACDEKVIKTMEKDERRAYSMALIHCSAHRKLIAACPLAFGEVDVKDRVKSVMNYKSPALWIVAAAVAAAVVAAVCLLTNPIEDNVYSKVEGSAVKWFDFLESGEELQLNMELAFTIEDFPGVTFRWTPEKIEAISDKGTETLITGNTIWNAYFCKRNKYSKPELCVTISEGDGEPITGVRCYDYERGHDWITRSEEYDYIYRYDEKNGLLYLDRYEHGEFQPLANALEFFEEYHEPLFSENNLEHAVTNAIMERNKSHYSLGYVEVESHEILDIVENKTGTEVTVYALVLHQIYGPQEGNHDQLEETGGSYIPTAITFNIDEYGSYTLQEYWIPRDGSYYADDIKDKFPFMAQLKVWNAQDYIGDLEAECQRKVLAVLGKEKSFDWHIYDTFLAEKFAAVHDAISHATSLAPCVYFAEQFPQEYATLTSYEEFTLRYCFKEFLQGDLHCFYDGCLMEEVCQDIAAQWGEAWTADYEVHGQEWFDTFKRNAQELRKQYSAEEIEKYYPVSKILLQMLDDIK